LINIHFRIYIKMELLIVDVSYFRNSRDINDRK
jgi:hypothetical protein